jgi:hypothetical protein
MNMKKTIETPGEAISVLIQVAELAQSRGVLSFDDAGVTKSAIDFLNELAGTKQEGPASELEVATEA